MSQLIAKTVQCRYLKRTNTIKSSNFEMNLDTLDAYSYDWWLFCTKANGKVIFNHTTYSPPTCKHQGKAFKVLGYECDLELSHTRKSLSNLNIALDDEIHNVKRGIMELIKTIRKPRTRKSTNLKRKEKITQLLKHISKVRSIKKELALC